MSSEKLSFLKSLGFNIEEIEITERGFVQYKCRRKRTRLRTHKNYLRRVQNTTLVYLVRLLELLKSHGMKPSTVDRPLLVDIIMKIFSCSRRTAYDYARALQYIDMSYF